MNLLGTTKLNLNEELFLRPLKESDYEDIYKNYASKDYKDVTKYLCWNPHKDINETKELVEKWIKEYSPSTFRWAIAAKSNSEVFGMIDCVKVDLENESCELGYVLAPSKQNKGIMSKAVDVISTYLFIKIRVKKIIIKFLKENEASSKVALKNGFKIVKEEEPKEKLKKKGKIIVVSEKLNPYFK